MNESRCNGICVLLAMLLIIGLSVSCGRQTLTVNNDPAESAETDRDLLVLYLADARAHDDFSVAAIDPFTGDPIFLETEPLITFRSGDIRRAAKTVDRAGNSAASIELTQPASLQLQRLSNRYIGKQIAVMWDDRIIAAPQVNMTIGQFMVSSGHDAFTSDDVDEFVERINLAVSAEEPKTNNDRPVEKLSSIALHLVSEFSSEEYPDQRPDPHSDQAIYLTAEPMVTFNMSDIDRAQLSADNRGVPMAVIRLNDRAGEILQSMADQYMHQQIAVLWNENVVTVARVNTPLTWVIIQGGSDALAEDEVQGIVDHINEQAASGHSE